MDEDTYWKWENIERLAMFTIPTDIWLAVVILLTEMGRMHSFWWLCSVVLFIFHASGSFIGWIVIKKRLK